MCTPIFLKKPGVAFFAIVTLVPLAISAEIPSGPPELVDFVEKAIAARKSSIDGSIGEKVAALNENYKAALQRVGEDAQSRGDLEAAILIKSELDRMEAGEPFDLKKEIPLTGATRVVYTYSNELEKLAERQDFLQKEFAAKIDRGLEQLVAELTRADRIEDALLVREYRKGDSVSRLARGSGASFLVGLTDDPDAVSPEPDTSVEVKIPADAISTADLPPGRLVFVPFQQGPEIPEVFQKIATDDPTDIALVGRSNIHTLGAIRNDGTLLYWRYSSDPAVVPGTNIYCGQSHGFPMIGLDRSGTINASPFEDPEMMAVFGNTGDAVHLGITFGVCAISHRSGTIDVVGSRDDHPNAVAIETISNGAAVEFSGLAFASVLKTDGTVVDIAGGKISEPKVRDPVVKLHAFRLGEGRDGELIDWSSGAEQMLKDVGPNPKQVFRENDIFVAIGEEGEFVVYRRDEGSPWQKIEQVVEALSGANSFAWLDGDGQEWLAVVLPAESVSRSGVWTLEELAAERSNP